MMFVVLAHRWGEDTNHSYLVGVFDEKVKAVRAALTEEYCRGGKYDCQVIETAVNEGCDPLSSQKEKEDYVSKEMFFEGEFAQAIAKRMESE